MNANEVLWIGDSWILVPGSQHTRVRDSARAAGAIGPSDDYIIGAAAATTMATIANQYAAEEAGATKVKVLIMDGGTWDTIADERLGRVASTSAASTFSQLLATVASDGTVEHVIYFLTPELPRHPGRRRAAPARCSRPARRARCRATSSICSRSGPAIPNTPPPTGLPVPTDAAPPSSPTRSGPSCSRTASRNDDCVIESPLYLHIHSEPTLLPRQRVPADALLEAGGINGVGTRTFAPAMAGARTCGA